MRNVWDLFRSDLSHLFANVMSTIIVIGLVVIPSIFAWYNTIACWNVFDNTGNLKVAVASVDEGYESDLIPLRINVGEQVISALRANEDIAWTFTTEEDAIDGARSGRYYAAVVIPESFSRDMLTFYSSDAEHADIIYYANEKKSAIAPKITDQGADAVSKQVNEVFTSTLSEIALSIADSLSSYAQESDVDGRVADLSDHVRSMADEIDRAASALGLYSTLARSTSELATSSAALMDSVHDEASALAAESQADRESVSGLVDSLEQSMGQLSDAVDAGRQSLEEMAGNVDALFDAASEDAQGCAALMRQKASSLDAQAEHYRQIGRQIEQLADAVPAEYAPTLDAAAKAVYATCDLLDGTSDRLNEAAGKLEAGDADVSAERAQIKDSLSAAQSSLDGLKTSFDQDIQPLLTQLSESCSAVVENMDASLVHMDGMGSDLSGAVSSAAGDLGAASGKIDEAADELRASAVNLRNLADAVDKALAAGDIEALRDVLGSNVQSLASALASPVGVERIAVFPSENFGSSMAPLYTTLALFIGSLLIMVAVKPQVSPRAQSSLRNPKPHELFLGRFGVVALISLLQTTLMGLGNMFFLQVQVAHPMLFMLCFWVSGLVFSFLIYALVAAFANLGKAAAVLLLIVQVTGCGGSFPLQILPPFVQAVSPFLPATHVVDAMRAAMFGTYGADFWVQMGYVLLFLIPAAFIGLVLRRPLEKFMAWYIEKVESSKLVG